MKSQLNVGDVSFHPLPNKKHKDKQVLHCGGLVLTDNPVPGVVGAKTKNIAPAALAQGSVTGKIPNRGKTGTINSQLLAQTACRKLDTL